MSAPLTKLGKFLRQRSQFIVIDDLASYTRPRVQLHGQGIVLRDRIVGSDIKTKKQQVIRTGDLLVAEIDAKVGGFGLVPADLDGAIVSSHYYLFEIDESQCLKGWLDAYVRSGQLEEQVTARGSTNYAAIRPDAVLEWILPLPEPEEQQHILERVVLKLNEVRKLQAAINEEAPAFVAAALRRVFGA